MKNTYHHRQNSVYFLDKQKLHRYILTTMPILGNKLELGIIDGRGIPLEMTPEMRSTHLYACGATGTGKSKMLEHLIRQDIKRWPEHRCGALIIDPHGSLYDSLISWIAWNEKYLKGIPIVPIDLRQKDWTIAYNVMRPRPVADPAVTISNFIMAMAYVWGADGTQDTPLFARVGKEVLWPLYEKKLTLLESEHLVDRVDRLVRKLLTEDLSKNSVARSWAYANTLSPRDFDAQFSSTVNRFTSFLHAEKLRLMFGQDGTSLDLGRALEEGQIIIANLSTQDAQVSEEDASLFATLLLSDLWTAAKERGKGTEEGHMKPFYVYIDEFQNFVTPTIAKNLDQARGFGLHLTLANQFPRQILHAGANGVQVYDSVMANARSKIVFSLEGTENLKPLAESLFMGVMNPDEIKLQLYSRKVMDYVEEERTIRGMTENWNESEGSITNTMDAGSTGGAVYGGTEQDARLWNQSSGQADGTSHTRTRGGARSETTMPFLRPVFGEELSSVQYRNLDEQLFRAMATLFDQQQRHGVARLVGMRAPIKIVTPSVTGFSSSKQMIDSYLLRIYDQLPFALRSAVAHERIEERQKRISELLLHDANAEPITARRQIS